MPGGSILARPSEIADIDALLARHGQREDDLTNHNRSEVEMPKLERESWDLCFSCASIAQCDGIHVGLYL